MAISRLYTVEYSSIYYQSWVLLESWVDEKADLKETSQHRQRVFHLTD